MLTLSLFLNAGNSWESLPRKFKRQPTELFLLKTCVVIFQSLGFRMVQYIQCIGCWHLNNSCSLMQCYWPTNWRCTCQLQLWCLALVVLPECTFVRYRPGNGILVFTCPYTERPLPRENCSDGLAVSEEQFTEDSTENGSLLHSGNTVIIGSITSVMIALAWAGVQFSWSSAQVLVPLILGGVGIIAFFMIESMCSWIKEPTVSRSLSLSDRYRHIQLCTLIDSVVHSHKSDDS